MNIRTCIVKTRVSIVRYERGKKEIDVNVQENISKYKKQFFIWDISDVANN